jgi:5-methylcytosine-specific restriction endonuclease McrA
MGKVRDPFYVSRQWLGLRAAALKRDGYRCQAPGCTARATIVDHIISRRRGGADALPNLRSLCRLHDNRAKEGKDGLRRSGGALANGFDAFGLPLDPSHHWNAS